MSRNNTKQLWPCQRRTSREIAKRREVRRLLVSLPTGGGKTIVAVDVIRREVRAGKRVLFLAHTREIVQQAFDKLIAWGLPREKVGVILSRDNRVNPDAPVQVASIQTLSRRSKPPADLVIIDEAHHAVADTYQRIASLYLGARLLGLTATPERGDGRGMREAFDELYIGATTQDLIDDGKLARPRVWTVPAERRPDLKGVRVVAGDYNVLDLERRVTRKGLVGDLVGHYEKHGLGLATVVYAVTKAHARKIARAFAKKGHDTETLFGETSLSDRERIIARLAHGEPVVVVNVGVLTEGWDCPPAKCCILARPTRSRTLHIQIVGRFLRKWKRIPIILDHAGNTLAHGLPQQSMDYALDADRAKRGGAAPAKMCPECHAVVATGTTACPECGHEFKIEREPAQQRGELVEMRATEEEKEAARARLAGVAKARGLSATWVTRALVLMFGDAA